MYKANSLESLKHGLNRYLKSPPHSKKFDIIKDMAFNEANELQIGHERNPSGSEDTCTCNIFDSVKIYSERLHCMNMFRN